MAALIRVSIKGSMPGGEVWSVNPIWKQGTGDLGLTFTQAQAIATNVSAISLSIPLRSLFSAETRIVGCRVESRDTGGTLFAQAEASVASVVGGSGAQNHPFQTSIVQSLRTAVAGARGRGRLYWPATGLALDSASLRVPTASVSAALGAVKAYLASIDTIVKAQSAGSTLCVWSRTDNVLRDVNEMRMGDVLDVQRRRRDALVEGVTVTAYP